MRKRLPLLVVLRKGPQLSGQSFTQFPNPSFRTIPVPRDCHICCISPFGAIVLDVLPQLFSTLQMFNLP
jgi:hypothetical protein